VARCRKIVNFVDLDSVPTEKIEIFLVNVSPLF